MRLNASSDTGMYFSYRSFRYSPSFFIVTTVKGKGLQTLSLPSSDGIAFIGERERLEIDYFLELPEALPAQKAATATTPTR